MTPPVVARTRDELAAARDAMAGRVAVVMTMGALHSGHAQLIRVARDHADSVLVTIFVNPLQFGPGEDLQRYPRTLDADLAVCEAEGVAVVFAPDVDVMYPPGEVVAKLHAGDLGDQLEGAIRPGHFDGVLTVVAKLLQLTRPDVAIFGEKDAQQLALIRRMIVDQAFPIEVVGAATEREADGLALSSRNRYLDAEGRQSALALSRALRAGSAAAVNGAGAALSAAQAVLAQSPEVNVDYLVIVDEETWQEPDQKTRIARILVAGRIGTTRLIDNVSVVLGTQQSVG